MLTVEERKRIEEQVRLELAEEQRRNEEKIALIQQIEHGELKREAQNQYWEDVRARVLQETQPNRPFWRSHRAGWTIALTAAAVIALPFHWSSRANPLRAGANGGPTQSQAAPAGTPRFFSMNETIVAGRFAVLAGDQVEFPIRITPEMAGAMVKGSFSAGCESGNCVRAAIVDEANHADWIRNRPAKVLWPATGQPAGGAFEVALPPGNYFLVFSNGASSLSDKQVYLEAELNYKKTAQDR